MYTYIYIYTHTCGTQHLLVVFFQFPRKNGDWGIEWTFFIGISAGFSQQGRWFGGILGHLGRWPLTCIFSSYPRRWVVETCSAMFPQNWCWPPFIGCGNVKWKACGNDGELKLRALVRSPLLVLRLKPAEVGSLLTTQVIHRETYANVCQWSPVSGSEIQILLNPHLTRCREIDVLFQLVHPFLTSEHAFFGRDIIGIDPLFASWFLWTRQVPRGAVGSIIGMET